MSEDCLFCKIAKGVMPSKKVFEDDRLIVIEDIDPQAPHHLLIIPRKHIRTVIDLTTADNEMIGHVYQVAGKVAHDLGFADDGFRVVVNCNAAGGQMVWHIHFHLLGGRDMTWPPG